MTGQEWEDKFRKERGRVARREEYRAAAARNFEPEEAPVVAPVAPAPKVVAKKSSGKSKRALFLLLAVVVAIVAGAMTYKLTHSKSDNRQPSQFQRPQQTRLQVLFLLQVVVQVHQALAHQVQPRRRTFQVAHLALLQRT